MPKTQNYSKTGISGVHISFKQDVEPKVKQLNKSGITVDVFRYKTKSKTGNFVPAYNVYWGNLHNEDTLVFITSNIAAVWTYLVGLESGSKMMKPVYLPPNSNELRLPSTVHLKNLLLGKVYDDPGRNADEWKECMALLQEKIDEKRIPNRLNGSLDQIIVDIQTAFYLNAEERCHIAETKSVTPSIRVVGGFGRAFGQ